MMRTSSRPAFWIARPKDEEARSAISSSPTERAVIISGVPVKRTGSRMYVLPRCWARSFLASRIEAQFEIGATPAALIFTGSALAGSDIASMLNAASISLVERIRPSVFLWWLLWSENKLVVRFRVPDQQPPADQRHQADQHVAQHADLEDAGK